MATDHHKQETSSSFGRWIGMLFALIGASGLIALFFLSGMRGFEALSEPLAIIGITVLCLVLISIGLFMAVRKRQETG